MLIEHGRVRIRVREACALSAGARRLQSHCVRTHCIIDIRITFRSFFIHSMNNCELYAIMYGDVCECECIDVSNAVRAIESRTRRRFAHGERRVFVSFGMPHHITTHCFHLFTLFLSLHDDVVFHYVRACAYVAHECAGFFNRRFTRAPLDARLLTRATP